MKYQYLITRIISEFIFPKLVSSQRTIIIRCVLRVVNELDKFIKLYTIYDQLTIEAYRDIYVIVNMIMPFIEESQKSKLTDLSEIPDKFTNLRYNLGADYVYGFKDIIKSTDYLVNITIPKVINKLYVNWLDIFPDMDNNNGFNSVIKFAPKIRDKKDKNILYEFIQNNITKDFQKWKDAVFFFLSSDSDRKTYSDMGSSFIEMKNLKENTYHNWFEAETFNWLSQIHFFNHFLANRVIFLTAGTGVGKSTHIPKLAMYTLMAFEDVKEPKLIVTQPRQFPAEGVPSYISMHMGIPIKKFKEKYDDLLLDDDASKNKKQSDFYIQYQHGGRQHLTTFKKAKHRTIKYVTDQLLFNELIGNPALLDENNETIYDVIMIDEAHEHNIRMDMILTILKKTLQLNSKIRVVIISATMEDDEARYRQFYNSIKDPFPEIDRRLHIANPLQKNRFVIKEHFEKKPVADYIEAGIAKIQYILKTSQKGDILFFLTGSNDINLVAEKLNSETPKYVIALPLYAELETERQNYAKDSLPKEVPMDRKTATLPLHEQINNSLGKYTRKIVLATSIAEASVTIKNLVYVIDIGFSKSSIYNPDIKLATLKAVPISMSSHTQRRGRAGRVSDGEAYYLYTHADIKDSKIIADIKITDLSNDVFQLLKNEEDSENGFDKTTIYDAGGLFHIVHPEDDRNERNLEGIFINEIENSDNKLIDDAFEHLEQLKLIDSKGIRTDLGIFMLQLNSLTKLTISQKLAIIYSLQCNYSKYIIPILSFVERSSYKKFFTNPIRGLLKFGNPFGDHITILKIFYSYQKKYSNLFINMYSKKSIDEYRNYYQYLDSTESDKFEKTLINIIIKYCRKYGITYKIEKSLILSGYLNKIIEKEIKLIESWCLNNYIDPVMMTKYLENYTMFLYYSQTIQTELNKFNLLKYKLKSHKIYRNIIQILEDSSPRNVGFVGNDGIYKTKYNVLLDIPTKYDDKKYKTIPLTSYKSKSKKIFYSNIRDFGETTQIDHVSKS